LGQLDLIQFFHKNERLTRQLLDLEKKETQGFITLYKQLEKSLRQTEELIKKLQVNKNLVGPSELNAAVKEIALQRSHARKVQETVRDATNEKTQIYNQLRLFQNSSSPVLRKELFYGMLRLQLPGKQIIMFHMPKDHDGLIQTIIGILSANGNALFSRVGQHTYMALVLESTEQELQELEEILDTTASTQDFFFAVRLYNDSQGLKENIQRLHNDLIQKRAADKEGN